jgi:hypothetical protein
MTSKEPAAAGQAGRAAQKAEDTAGTVRDSKAFGALLAGGLVTYGVLHLVIAWTALQLAWGSSGGSADEQGALHQLASTPAGPALLWAAAIGLFALVLWRLGLAAWGFTWYSSTARRALRRLGSVAQSVVYAALGVSAVAVATGAGQSSGGGGEESISARLLAQPFGRALLLVLAGVVAGVGVYLAIRGIRQKFTDELVDGGSPGLNRVGQIGYVAKSLALVLVGALFGWAALSHDADKAGGLDAALHTVRQQPFGAILLTVFAVGLAAFGLFCFGWARRARRS